MKLKLPSVMDIKYLSSFILRIKSEIWIIPVCPDAIPL